MRKERVARKEREEDDARLDEDDDEDEAVCGNGTGCDHAGDGRAGVLKKLGNKLYESHG